MQPPTIRRLLTLLGLALISATVALAQSTSFGTQTWLQSPTFEELSGHTIVVVTKAEPTKRRSCKVSSIDAAELVCKHAGRQGVRYPSQAVAALIYPGVNTRWWLYMAAFAGAGAAATWGTVVLSATCTPCAVATAAGAAVLYLMALTSPFLTDGDFSDVVVYLAPGQTLQARLH